MNSQKIEVNKDVVEEMFQAGAHFGYDKSRRHPSSKNFMFGRKDDVEIFDLEKVYTKLHAALQFVEKLGQENKQILFIGGKKEAQTTIKDSAESIDQPYVNGRFIGGSITNFEEIRKRVQKYLDLSSQKEKGELAKYTKKERLMIDREIERLEEKFGGISNMEKLPGAVFIVDADREYIARDEAIQRKIPVISLAGSDNDFTKINYSIPANDSSIKSIQYFVGKIVEAYKKGSANKNSTK